MPAEHPSFCPHPDELCRRRPCSSRAHGIDHLLVCCNFISQMIWVWSVSLPLTLLNSTEVNPGLSARDVVGGIMFVVGFVFELGSDVQKDIFKVGVVV